MATDSETPGDKLTVEACIRLTRSPKGPTAVSRGMTICSCDGQAVGKVAGVMINGQSQVPTHLVLVRSLPEYRLVPIDQINQIDDQTVWLTINGEKIARLAHHIS